MQELRPDLSPGQLANHWDHTSRAKAVPDGFLKKNTVKAQATTAKRNAITVSQQYRWHCTVDEAYNIL
jgi:hypothetical protein